MLYRVSDILISEAIDVSVLVGIILCIYIFSLSLSFPLFRSLARSDLDISNLGSWILSESGIGCAPEKEEEDDGEREGTGGGDGDGLRNHLSAPPKSRGGFGRK